MESAAFFNNDILYCRFYKCDEQRQMITSDYKNNIWAEGIPYFLPVPKGLVEAFASPKLQPEF